MSVKAMKAGRASLGISPVTGTVGAEVQGIDLSRPLDAATDAELRSALDRHLVLFFRAQNLTPLQLKAFVGTFGPIFHHPRVKGLPEAPEVLELRKEPGGALFAGEDWHADVTWQDPCGYVSVLHGLEIPSAGGDTCFASLSAAFDSLSEGMQAMLRKLRAVHTYKMQKEPGVFEDRTAIHPVVRRHPATGREGYYLNGMFVTHFEGLTAEESRPLLDYLLKTAVRPEFTCRFRWQKGSVALWDNRFTLHLPVNDFNTERRVMIRATALEG
jgi:taurine dioxygenase